MRHIRALTVARAQDDTTDSIADLLQGINTILSTTFDFILSVITMKEPDETQTQQTE